MKALVTGASGFIGSHLLPLLAAQGVNIRAMVQPGQEVSSLARLGVEIVTSDVRDLASLAAAVDGVDAVFHLAGLLTAHSRRRLLEILAPPLASSENLASPLPGLSITASCKPPDGMLARGCCKWRRIRR
jgi:putative NADH-flavin reductase